MRGMPETSTPSAPSVAASDTLTVDRAIADLRRGGIVAVRGGVDGDRLAVAAAAEMATEDLLGNLARLAGSEPALAITRNRAVSLGSAGSGDVVSLTIPRPVAAHRILSLADPTEGPADLAGLTALPEPDASPASAALRLIKLARLLPAALVASVPGLASDGMTAWSTGRGLLMVDRSAIDVHRQSTARRLSRAASARVPLADAEDAELIAFRPPDGGTEHVAIRIGKPDPSRPVLVRLHSQCLTGDLLGSLRCDCGDQLRGAIREIAADGGGILVYLAQEGRDIGLINKLKAYRLQDLGADTVDANTMLGFDDDERLFQPAAQILTLLGIRQVRLLTNNPAKIEQLARCGVDVVERVPHVVPSNRHNERYLSAKASRSGHLI